MHAKPARQEPTPNPLPLMLLQVPLPAKIVPLEVLLRRSVEPHQLEVPQQRANRVLLAKRIRQVPCLLLLVNALHALLGNLPLVVLLMEPIRVPFVVPVNFNLALLRVRAVTAAQELTSKRLLLMQLLVPLPAQFVCPERIKIPPAVHRASFVHRGQS